MTLDLVDDWQVIVGVEVVEGNVDDKNSVEVDKEMSDWPFFKVDIEKYAAPVNSVEFHVSMHNWEIDKVCLQGILVSPQESQKETGMNPVIEHNILAGGNPRISVTWL